MIKIGLQVRMGNVWKWIFCHNGGRIKSLALFLCNFPVRENSPVLNLKISVFLDVYQCNAPVPIIPYR